MGEVIHSFLFSFRLVPEVPEGKLGFLPGL